MLNRRAFCSLSLALMVSGCATNNQLVHTEAQIRENAFETKAKLHTYSQADALQDVRISLPQNYDPSNYKKMRLGVSFYPADLKNPDQFSDIKSDTVSALFETEISKLKRFTVISMTKLTDKAIRDAKNHQDRVGVEGDNVIRFGRRKGIDYVVIGGVSLHSEKQNRLSKSDYFFTVMVDYKLINVQTREIVDADTAEGRAKRRFYETPSGVYVGGFNYHNRNDLKAAWNEASYAALRIIANKIGNKFPVGGRVTGILRDRIQMNAGYEQGLMGKQIGVLYTNVGVDLPLAYVNLEPGRKETTGKVIRWSQDPDAQELIAQIKGSARGGMAFLRDFPETYIVSKNMPLPPEWDINYKDQM